MRADLGRRRVFRDTRPGDDGHDWSELPDGAGRWGGLVALVGFVGLSLLVGVVGGIVTAPAVRGWYLSLTRPPGTPPDWVFAPVWTVLYVLIGVAALLVWKRASSPATARRARSALRLWGWQLLVNAAWSPAFFALHSVAAAFVILLLLLGLIVLTLRAFVRIQPVAGVLLLPYLAWVCYATYLNAGFWLLNRV